MILRSLTVEGFRSITGPLHLEFARGVTLIAGPNGAGKSTLLAAVEAALAVPAGSAEARQYAPWASALTPAVTLDFEHSGTAYRVEKTLGGAVALWKNGGAELAAKGAAAEELLRGMVYAGKARERGLLRILLARQDAREVELPAGELRERLSAAIGAQSSDPRALRFRKILARRVELEFTPGRGDLRKNHPLLAARAELAHLRGELDGARSLIQECERWEQAAAQARAEEAAAQRELDELQPLLSQVEQALRLSGEEKQADNQAAALSARLQQAEDLARLDARLLALAERVPRMREEAGRLEEAARQAREQELTGLQREVEALAGPAGAEIQTASAARQAAELARGKVESSQLRFTFTAEAACDVEVVEGAPFGLTRLPAGDSLTVRGEGRLRLRIPGAGLVEVAGPSVDLSRTRRELEAAEAQWQAFAAQHGTDLAALEARAGNRQAAEAKLRERRAAPLDEAVRQARAACDSEARLEAELRQQRARYPAALAPPGAMQAGLLEAERRRDQARQALAALPSGIVEQRVEIDARRRAAEARRAKARDDMQRAEGQAAALRQRAPFGGVARLEQSIEAQVYDVDTKERAANSLRLLFDTVERAFLKEREGLTAPVAAAATRIYEELTVNPPDRIEVTDGWVARPAGHDEEDYSLGEREQLHFAVRLAWADLLAREEPHVLVFDDALVHTDDERMSRALRLLAQRKDRLQVIVLTCHPERYAELAPERVYRLRSGALAVSSA